MATRIRSTVPSPPPNVLSSQPLDILKSSDDTDDARERGNLVGLARPGNPTSVPCPPLDQLHSDSWPSQRQFSDVVYRPVLYDVFDKASKISRPLDAWIRSFSCFGAYQWLSAIPGISFFECSFAVYPSMLRVWLGLPIVNVSLVDQGSFLSGSHWDSICCGCIPCRNMRHDLVRDIWYRAFLEVGTSVQREPKGLYQGSNSRPADLLLPPVKPGECH